MKYQDKKIQAIYENACDCIYYGYGKKTWNTYDVEKKEVEYIWQEARKTIENEKRY